MGTPGDNSPLWGGGQQYQYSNSNKQQPVNQWPVDEPHCSYRPYLPSDTPSTQQEVAQPMETGVEICDQLQPTIDYGHPQPSTSPTEEGGVLNSPEVNSVSPDGGYISSESNENDYYNFLQQQQQQHQHVYAMPTYHNMLPCTNHDIKYEVAVKQEEQDITIRPPDCMFEQQQLHQQMMQAQMHMPRVEQHQMHQHQHQVMQQQHMEMIPEHDEPQLGQCITHDQLLQFQQQQLAQQIQQHELQLQQEQYLDQLHARQMQIIEQQQQKRKQQQLQNEQQQQQQHMQQHQTQASLEQSSQPTTPSRIAVDNQQSSVSSGPQRSYRLIIESPIQMRIEPSSPGSATTDESDLRSEPCTPPSPSDRGLAVAAALDPHRRRAARPSMLERSQYQCDICREYFARQCGLTQHKKWIHTLRQLPCEKCGKKFPTPAELDRHMGQHMMADKPYKCDICPKQFCHKNDLKRHRYRHDDCAPFVCHMCNKSFIRQDHLVAHLMSHERRQAMLEARERQGETDGVKLEPAPEMEPTNGEVPPEDEDDSELDDDDDDD